MTEKNYFCIRGYFDPETEMEIVKNLFSDAAALDESIRKEVFVSAEPKRIPSLVGYHMVFGDENKNKPFYNKRIKGCGYVDDGSSVLREFYSPLVPKSYNLLEEFAESS